VLLWGESQRDIEMCKEVLEQARARAAGGPGPAHSAQDGRHAVRGRAPQGRARPPLAAAARERAARGPGGTACQSALPQCQLAVPAWQRGMWRLRAGQAQRRVSKCCSAA